MSTHLLVARTFEHISHISRALSRSPPGEQRNLASAELEGLGAAQRVQVHVAQPLSP